MTGDALLIVGHGFPNRPQKNHPVRKVANQLEQHNYFKSVAPAFVKGTPSLAEQLTTMRSSSVIVVPMFVSNGYFVDKAIPEILESNSSPGTDIAYTDPVGTHPLVSQIIFERAHTTLPSDTEHVELAVIGHGSSHGPWNKATIETHAARIRKGEVFHGVRSYFIEESPTLNRLPIECEGPAAVVVPVFMAEGHHVRDDIPDLLDIEGRRGTTNGTELTCTPPVGSHTLVSEVIIDLATGNDDTRVHSEQLSGPEPHHTRQ
jgi:sirohydrochlorin ferrochelatase